jgi:hypothetical protein
MLPPPYLDFGSCCDYDGNAKIILGNHTGDNDRLVYFVLSPLEGESKSEGEQGVFYFALAGCIIGVVYKLSV